MAIGAAIAAAVFIIYKFRDRISEFVDFIKGIPATIGNFIKDRFIECDKNGKELKKVIKKEAKKIKKDGK